MGNVQVVGNTGRVTDPLTVNLNEVEEPLGQNRSLNWKEKTMMRG